MERVIWNGFMDEMEKISGSIVRGPGAGGKRWVSKERQHRPSAGFDLQALFQGTEASEAAKEFEESKRMRAAGEQIKSVARKMGVEPGEGTISQRKKAIKASIKGKK